MKSSQCVLPLLAACVTSACSFSNPHAILPAAANPATRMIRVGVVEDGRTVVRSVSVEAYVEATILSEFAPGSGDPATVERMFELQAVLGRTYALAHRARHTRDGFDLCATTHCQLYQPSRLDTSRWAPQAASAVRRTSHTVLWYAGAPATVLYHADCGGRTSRPAAVWGGTDHPYLVSIQDDGPAARAHHAWRYEAPRAAVQQALDRDERTRVAGPLEGISVLDRDAGGRAVRVALLGARPRTIRGEVLRDVLARAFGARSIRSTSFAVRFDGATFLFEGRGFGHGVGLCQAGALARIRAGARVPSILERYFPGTKLVVLAGRDRDS